MNKHELSNKLFELDSIELQLKESRDYSGLINIHMLNLDLDDSDENHLKRIPQIAYCFARLGRKVDAKEVIDQISDVSYLADRNVIVRMYTLVMFFIQSDVSEFSLMKINTIKSWIKHPKACEQVKLVIFDYHDIIGQTEEFDSNRLKIRQEYFPDELVDLIFSCMARDEGNKIYYNREKNDIQEEIDGYLSSLLNHNQTYENRLLAERIRNQDPVDHIIDGIHFEIPVLKLNEYIEAYAYDLEQNPEIANFVDEFKKFILSNYYDNMEELLFNNDVSTVFYKFLKDWLIRNNLDSKSVKDRLENARKCLALNFLFPINEIDLSEDFKEFN